MDGWSVLLNEEAMAQAWREFVYGGVLDKDVVRPEIARSWMRCREKDVDPWSTSRLVDEARLDKARHDHERLIRCSAPVIAMVSGLLDCNVSLMDEDAFVYHLVSPFATYSLALGAEMDEGLVGTCNAVLVKTENKPVRCDYYEHYKVSSQSYSSAAAPFLYKEDGRFGGAILINSPLKTLPDNAPTMASVAARLILKLFLLDKHMWQAISSMEFFSPLIQLCDEGIVLLDDAGHILTMNDSIGKYCPSWESAAYGSVSLKRYLVGGEAALKGLIHVDQNKRTHLLEFKGKRGKAPICVPLVASKIVKLGESRRVRLLRFGPPRESVEKSTRGESMSMHIGQGTPVVGESEAWKQVMLAAAKVAPLKVNVLLLGETGTGKEVLARAIHKQSGRTGAFVAINCGAIPRDLMESELFGYAPGAFTGAQAKGLVGKFEFADKGTVFLDEVGEMPHEIQVGLLRVIQEQSVTPLGSNTTKALDLRFIAATNQNVAELMSEKRFRPDLYHRIAQVEMILPPLRDRSSDIPLFVEEFNREISHDLGLPHSRFPVDAMQEFQEYSWPGNVRELRNVVERCLIFCGQGSEVTPADVRRHRSFHGGMFTGNSF